jgi:hypothetical protein
MALAMARFLSLFLTGVAAGIAFSHVLKSTAKAALSGPVYLDVQNTLLRDFVRAVGIVEALSLITTLVSLALARTKGLPIFSLTAAGFFLLLVAMLIRIVWVQPINRQIQHWTAEQLPATWTRYRDRWEFYHRLRALFRLIALSVLILALLIDRPLFYTGFGNM